MRIISFRKSHWPDISRIYKDSIETRDATFETGVSSWNKWSTSHLKICRLAAVIDGKIAGFSVLAAVSGRRAYEGVAEVSVYVDEFYRKRGVGYRLLNAIITCSEKKQIWTLQAGIFPENKISINLFRRCGFRTVGIREKIGQLDGIWRDVVLMERRSSYL